MQLMNNHTIDGYRPLCYAAKENLVDLVELLLDRGANVDGYFNAYAPKITHEGEYLHFTPLMLAAAKGHVDIARILIARGADLNIARPYRACDGELELQHGEHALCHAIWNKQTDMIKLLIESGSSAPPHAILAAMGSKDAGILRLVLQFQTPDPTVLIDALSRASLTSDLALLAVLIDAGVTMERKATTTVLKKAIAGGKVEAVRMLIKAGMGRYCYCASTPLMELLDRSPTQATKMTETLLETIERIFLCSDDALKHVIQSGNVDLAHTLVQADTGLPRDDQAKEALVRSAVEHPDRIRTLLKKGLDVKTYGARALQAAVEECNCTQVAALIALGADIHISFWNGETTQTLLERAFKLGDAGADIFKALLDAGADATPLLCFTSCDLYLGLRPKIAESMNRLKHANAALWAAVQAGDISLLDHALGTWACVDARNSDGITPLEYAAASGLTNIASILIAAGAKWDDLLLAFVRTGNASAVRVLISAGVAPLHEIDSLGLTALHIAVDANSLEVVMALLAADGDIDPKWSYEYSATPLIMAARRGYSDIINALVRAGASLVETDDHNMTACFAAARNGHGDCLRILLSAARAPPSDETHTSHSALDTMREVMMETDENERSMLMLAAAGGHACAVRALLAEANGCDLLLRDDNGMTALQHGRRHGEVRKLLIQAIVDETEKRMASLPLTGEHNLPEAI